MTTLREFRNADVPQLLQTWNAHFEAAGMLPQLTAAAFEQAIFDRLYFDPRRLIVALDDDRVVAFAHWMVVPGRPQEAVLPAICACPAAATDTLGRELLLRCEQAARAAGCEAMLGGTAAEHFSGYAGLSPLGPGEGILDADRVAAGWFMQNAYTPLHRIARYSVSLAQFRPPIDRMQMQLRRATSIEHQDVLPEGLRRAAALSHADLERFTARTRGGEDLAWAEFQLSCPEAQVFPTCQAILADWASLQDNDHGAAVKYTISAALQQLQKRGVTRVEAVAGDNQPDHAVTLRSLRFVLETEGTVFSKRL
ncbi:GNAT family N-acetyltransferase [Roseimaritima ulvae]|uniref:N-acetyltransferase domain-containing protein n=1 Tax=Roseimaritima ulvae TaxID=980254 RepID=A0A5B9R6E4_9BACT|nr:GNAT family N-acetyltransferase [Roseimaritima ulvae]QEG42111.1 hypothetical protein UC8_41430 [Roseimaritima ulvae]